LILDEPTSQLDDKTSKIISKNLINFAKKYQITLLIISHKNDFDLYADRVINLNP
jgi:ABC-type lipoprotein export system ATPase subunit